MVRIRLFFAAVLVSVAASCTCAYENDVSLPVGRFWTESLTFEYRDTAAALAPSNPLMTVTYSLNATGAGTFGFVRFRMGLKVNGQEVPLSRLLLSIDGRYGSISNFDGLPVYIRDRDLGTNGGFKIACEYRQALSGENPDIEVSLSEIVAVNTNTVGTNSVVVRPRKKCL